MECWRSAGTSKISVDVGARKTGSMFLLLRERRGVHSYAPVAKVLYAVQKN